MRRPIAIPVILLLGFGVAALLGSSIGNEILDHALRYYIDQLGLESKYPLYNGISDDPRIFLV